MRSPYRPMAGFTWGLVTFATVGTITAVWSNPYFLRMMPVAVWEFPAVVSLAILTGVFFSVRFPACDIRPAGIGGVLTFVGIACPICNKVLILIFGGPLLLSYFDPARRYVTIAGLILLVIEICRNFAARRGSIDTEAGMP